jgi:hypothetical protein
MPERPLYLGAGVGMPERHSMSPRASEHSESVRVARKQPVPECAGMCLESVRQADGACETSWCENGGQPIVGHALFDGIVLDSAGDERVVITPEEL